MPDRQRAAELAADALLLFGDRDYVQVHGFTEIRTMLQMADIFLRLDEASRH